MAITVVKQFAPTLVGDLTTAAIATTSIVGNGTTAVATTTPLHGYQVGDTVTIALSTHFNATQTVTAITVNTYSFASASNTTDTGAFTSTLTVSASLGTASSWSISSGCALHIRAGGPRNTGDTTANSEGWSIDTQTTNGTNKAYWQIGSVGQTKGGYSVWMFVKSILSTTHANSAIFFASAGGGNQYVSLDAATGDFWVTINNGTATDTGVKFPVKVWFELRAGWVYSGAGNVWQVGIQYRVAGSMSWVSIYSNAAITLAGATMTGVAAGNLQYAFGSTPFEAINGRFGMPTLFTMTAFSDFTAAIPNQIDPSQYSSGTPYAGYPWGFDPNNATGVASDSNPGTIAAPWLTMAKLNTELLYCGVFSSSIPWQNASGGVANGTAWISTDERTTGLAYRYGMLALTGDTLTVNNAGGAEIRVTVGLLMNTDLTLLSSGGVTAPAQFTGFAIVPPSAWSLVSGKTNTYQATITTTQTCLYEDRRPMNHPTGANYAAVATLVESTAGSFYSSNLIIYDHTFESGNPGSDGHIYEYTTLNGSGPVGIVNEGVNSLVRGINFSGTTGTDPSGGSNIGNYPFGTNGGVNTIAVWDTCVADYADKHAMGNVGNFTNFVCVTVNCIAQRGNPYAPAGGYWAYVDFMNNSGSAGSYYYNCSCGIGALQQIGTTLASTNGLAWGTHTNGSTGWTKADFDSCDFSKAGGISTEVGAAVTFNGGKLNGSVGGWPTSTFNEVMVTSCTGANGIFNSSIITYFPLTNRISLTGATLTANSSTIDYSAVTAPAIYFSGGSNTITLNQCVQIPGPSHFIDNLQGTDTFLSSQNEIQGLSSHIYLLNSASTSYTLAQSQAAGFDVGSVMNASIAVDPITYKRTAQSTVTKNVGAAVDFTGVTFNPRQTAGAYEYVGPSGASPTGDKVAQQFTQTITPTAANKWFYSSPVVMASSNSTPNITVAIPVDANAPTTVQWQLLGNTYSGGPFTIIAQGTVPSGYGQSPYPLVSNSGNSVSGNYVTTFAGNAPYYSFEVGIQHNNPAAAAASLAITVAGSV